jgi:hypothetical protein
VYARRRHWYFAMMGTCVVLFIMAWAVVRLWSVPAAIGMCVVAMVIPPVAAIVANRKGPEDRWWDDPTGTPPEPERKPPEPQDARVRQARHRHVSGDSGDPESDAWWAELDDGNRRDRRD